MGEISHEWKGQKIEGIENWKNAEITANFFDRNEVAMSLTRLEFGGADAVKIRNRAKESLMEGDDYRIIFGNPASPAYVFEANIDYADAMIFKGCNKCDVAIKQKQGRDWIDTYADGFNFPFLFQEGIITTSQFKKIPTVKNYLPNAMELLMLGISTFMMVKEAIQVAKDIATATSNIIEAFTPNTPSPAPSWSIGKIVSAFLESVLVAANAVLVTVALVKLTKAIKEQIYPATKNHLGMLLKDLFIAGCSYLDLGFKSSIFDRYQGLYILPVKDYEAGNPPNGVTELGCPTSADATYTFGDLIRIWSKIFNADFRVIDGIFEFEREDFWDSLSSLRLSPSYSNQETKEDEFSYNTNEVISNYAIDFALDNQDINTLDDSAKRIFQITTSVKKPRDKGLVNLKGFERTNAPYAYSTVKKKLTKVEKALKEVFKLSDKLTGRSDSTAVKDRIGSLHLSGDFVTVSKIVMMDGDLLAINQRDLFNADLLWENEHYIKSFVPVKGVHNQYRLYKDVEVKLCPEDFAKLQKNNKVITGDGEEGKIDKLVWRPYFNLAKIDYRIKDLHTPNLKLTKQ